MPLHRDYDFEEQGQKQLLVARSGSKEGEYVVGSKIIGKGATSVIKLAVHSRTNEPAAAKIVNLSLYSKFFEQELNALSRMNHRNIVKLLHYELSADKGSGALFLEYLPSPNLLHYVQHFGRLSEDIAFYVLSQIVDGFNYMHSLGFSHHDFKPENVSYDPFTHQIKILDFGLSQQCNAKPEYQGSPMYMAPEVHLRKPYDVFLADVWSIGICFYEILTGDTPWGDCMDTDDLLDKLLFDNQDTVLEVPEYLSSDAKFLLKSMLTRDYRSRITIDGVLHIFEKRKTNQKN